MAYGFTYEKGKTPIVVGVAYNELMSRWDVHCIVGNFEDQAEAEAASHFMMGMLKREFGLEEDVVKN